MRRAFSLFYVLVFLIIMSVVGLMMVEFTAYSTKHTARSFMDTRADLILRSATEYAIMALQAHDYKTTGDKIEEITMNYPGFIVHTRFHYFSTDCKNQQICSLISTPDTNMSVLIYVTVTSKNPEFHIRKVRVTLQNP